MTRKGFFATVAGIAAGASVKTPTPVTRVSYQSAPEVWTPIQQVVNISIQGSVIDDELARGIAAALKKHGLNG